MRPCCCDLRSLGNERPLPVSFPAGVCANLKNVNRFGEGLECLKIKLIEMSSLVENGIQRSIDAVVKRDQVAADEVMVAEARINLIELEIDALAIELLALHQPIASNLRLIVAVLKINTDLVVCVANPER